MRWRADGSSIDVKEGARAQSGGRSSDSREITWARPGTSWKCGTRFSGFEDARGDERKLAAHSQSKINDDFAYLEPRCAASSIAAALGRSR